MKMGGSGGPRAASAFAVAMARAADQFVSVLSVWATDAVSHAVMVRVADLW